MNCLPSGWVGKKEQRWSQFLKQKVLYFCFLITVAPFIPAVIIIMLLLLLTHSSLTVAVLRKQPVLSAHLAEWSNLMPSSALTTHWSQYFKFYVGSSWVGGWVGGCVLRGVNIHQEATYVCTGDHQLWNNSVLPRVQPGSPATRLEWKCAAGQSGAVIISSLH